MTPGMMIRTNDDQINSSFRRKPESSALDDTDYSRRSPYGSPVRRDDTLAITHMCESPHHQNGAAALMATVFLLLVMAILGGIGLRLSGTDIRDTGLQNDSVEALFLAESGVERALQQLASGTTCPDVAQPGTRFSLGRGDFEIQTSSVDAITSWCNVRILGRVLLAGSASAQRQIEVALRPPAGVGAWAVGKGGAIYAWSGSSWTAATSNTTRDLNAVHCVSATECWTVGDNGVIRHLVSGSWATTASGSTEDLRGVACIVGNPSACYAVGKDVVLRWNGSSWGASSFPGGKLVAISCTSSTCYTVEEKDNIWRLNTATNTWAVDVDNGEKWNAIHCLPGGECWAAGDKSGSSFQFARLLSGSWNTLQYNQSPAKDLYGIHCVASDTCWAVGEKRSGGLDLIIERASGGFAYITTTGGEDLNAISCSSASDCLAVGDKGDVQHWNGSNWAQAMTGMPNNIDMNGVAMASAAGGGTVQLMRWQEIIPP